MKITKVVVEIKAHFNSISDYDQTFLSCKKVEATCVAEKQLFLNFNLII